MTDSHMRLLLASCDLAESCLIQEAVTELTEDFRNPAGAQAYELTSVDLLEDVIDLLTCPRKDTAGGGDSPSPTSYDALLLDPPLPDGDGLSCLARIRTIAPDLPVVVLVGRDEQQLGMALVREGAQDFLVEDDIDCGPLARTLRHAVERARLSAAVRQSALLDSSTGCYSAAAFRLLAEHDWRLAKRLRMPFAVYLIHATETSEDSLITLVRAVQKAIPAANLVARLDERTFAALTLSRPDGETVSLGRLARAVFSHCNFSLGQLIPLNDMLDDARRRLCENEQVDAGKPLARYQLAT